MNPPVADQIQTRPGLCPTQDTFRPSDPSHVYPYVVKSRCRMGKWVEVDDGHGWVP
jgi:hypothetical protein